MDEIKELRDMITDYLEGDLDRKDIESEYEELCDEISDKYYVMEGERDEAVEDYKEGITIHEEEMADALEAREEILKGEGILPESLTDKDKIDILRLIYDKLTLPKLQQLRDSLGLRPSYIQNPAA